MKRFLFLALAILLMGGVAFADTPGSTQDPGVGDIMGQGKFQSDPHRIFRMVRTISTTDLLADSIVRWDLVEDDGVTISYSPISNDSAVAGIIVNQCLAQETAGNTAVQDRGKKNWTWLQTYGLSTVRVEAAAYSNVVAGDAMGMSNVSGKATKFLPSTSLAGRNGNAGFFYDTEAITATSAECFLSLD